MEIGGCDGHDEDDNNDDGSSGGDCHVEKTMMMTMTLCL